MQRRRGQSDITLQTKRLTVALDTASSSIDFIVQSARDPEDAGKAGREDRENQRESQKNPQIVRVIERHFGSALLRV
ncbi:hypothetical protein H4W29_006674 [Rhizobium viscosum]|uniref:Uncharacterized protein n=1 Tax=Rhizobium viscosum TaxID=1673 RepID=A0ABR9J1R9_RHIVS|nr:hypothetical protein [Rhizobium viscosum]